MTSRQDRIDHLSRVNKGQKLLPTAITELSELLDRTVDRNSFASLEETDQLLSAARRGYEACHKSSIPCFQRRFSTSAQGEVFALCHRLADAVNTEDAWLLHRYDRYCGAVSANVRGLLSRVETVISPQQNSITIIALDQQQGLLLDYEPADLLAQVFELAVWGDWWSSLLLEKTSEHLSTEHQPLSTES